MHSEINISAKSLFFPNVPKRNKPFLQLMDCTWVNADSQGPEAALWPETL